METSPWPRSQPDVLPQHVSTREREVASQPVTERDWD
jgi:hypothetical protein